MGETLTPDGIMQLGLGFWGSKTLLSAVELGLFTELASGPLEGEELRQRLGLLMSLNMLIELPGGFESTGAECAGWLREAGFREASVAPLAGPDSMVVGVK